MVVLRATIVLIFAITWTSLAAAQVRVTADRISIEQDETFNLTYTFAGNLNGEPDFAPLEKDFQVISQNRRSNLQIVNGTTQYELSWVLTLLAKRTGDLIIPEINFGVFKSGELDIKVEAAANPVGTDLGDIFLETEFLPTEGYVQGQYIFTVRIFFRGWLVDGELSPPDIGSQDVVVRSLGEPRRYSKTRNGERYQVYERRHALFPQSSGTLSVGASVFSGRLRLPTGGNRLKRVTVPGVTAAVNPRPASFTGKVWLPAESVELVEVWPQDTLVFEQGVPITRTITIKANGLDSAQLPQIEMPSNDQVRVYPGQPNNSDRLVDGGVQGERTESVAIVPQVSGDIVLPAVRLAWWDTVNNEERIAEIPARTINVAIPRGGVVGITDEVSGSSAQNATGVLSWQSNPWFWATLLCAIGWIVSLLKASPGTATATRDQVDEQPLAESVEVNRLEQALQKACKENSTVEVRALSEQLLRRRFNAESSSFSQIERDFTENMRSQWRGLNRALYGPNGVQEWQHGEEFWKAVQQQGKAQTIVAESLLQPL